MEVFSLITGILYLLLEIRQKNAMWIVGILTAGAAVVVFANEHLYASMCLNIYYVIISFWGLYTWKRDARKVASEEIHLEKLTLPTALISVSLLTGGTAGFLWLLRTLGDPMSGLDAFVTILSAIATWWLTRSIPQQWILWIIADALSSWLCWRTGIPWMALLYLVYCMGAVYGLYHWLKGGRYVQ